LIDATDDEVSEIKEADKNELSAIVDSLNNIQGEWNDWGKFRFASSNMVLNYLKQTGY
jgi:hypothetical protein